MIGNYGYVDCWAHLNFDKSAWASALATTLNSENFLGLWAVIWFFFGNVGIVQNHTNYATIALKKWIL